MKLTKRISKAIVGGLLGLTIFVPSYALAQESIWETKTPMPTARVHLRAAAIDGLLYVVGGHDGVTGAVGTLEVYDPGTDTWSTAASMPGIRYGGTIGVIDGKLYMVGGWNYPISGIPISTLQIYDPQTDTWSTGANMPILSGCNIAGVIDRKLYVLTPCFGYGGYYKFFHVYDPDSNTWTELTQPDKIQAEAAGGVIDGKFYVVGGFDGDAVTATVQVFDPEWGTWSLAASMSVPRQTLGAGVIDGKLYVVGGQTGTSTVVANTMEVFDPDTDSWSSAPPMPTARGLLKAAVIDGKLYVVGGWDESGPLNTLEVFGPVGTAPSVNGLSSPSVIGLIVPIDIEPRSCSNPLNVKSKGVLPVAILGTQDFDVAEIDPVSIRLEGVAPLRSALGDVATPFDGVIDDALDCTELDQDGFTDLTLKFRTQDVVKALGEVFDGNVLALELTGNFTDGPSILGEDVVVILKKGKN